MLVQRGLAQSRARARDAIVRGTVKVDGSTARKPGQMCAPDAEVTIDDPAGQYVSRAALKLTAALDRFGIPAAGQIALDLGASTGGFTQVLLQAGVAHVFAIDVGHGQLKADIANDDRVTAIEGLNARELTTAHLNGDMPTLITADLSFISLKLALPAALQLAAPAAQLITLVKPQFEVGRAGIGKGGIVAAHQAEAAAENLACWLDGQPGWSTRQWAPSPITGADGNREFLLWGSKAG